VIGSCLLLSQGLGGLVLAHLMKEAKNRPDVAVTVFERDTGDQSRDQGYAIGLTPETIGTLSRIYHSAPGLEALLTDKDNQYSRFNVLRGDGSQITTIKGGGAFVNRTLLRSSLLSDIDVRWGKQLVRYEESPGGVTAFFKDGTESALDYLIAADGANSAVRRQRAPSMEVRACYGLEVPGSLGRERMNIPIPCHVPLPEQGLDSPLPHRGVNHGPVPYSSQATRPLLSPSPLA
jgi:2-polyprenyl-6-methoxyphenol hydroxylase-like FAD-dependent oxidoreductase